MTPDGEPDFSDIRTTDTSKWGPLKNPTGDIAGWPDVEVPEPVEPEPEAEPAEYPPLRLLND